MSDGAAVSVGAISHSDECKCSPTDGKACNSLTEFAVLCGDRGGLQWFSMSSKTTFKRTVDRLGIWRPKRAGRSAFANFCPFCGVDVSDGFKAGCDDAPTAEG